MPSPWTPQILAEHPLREIQALDTIECGTEAAKHFMFDKSYKNLNSGAYGTIPRSINSALNHFHIRTEARPDPFVRYAYRPYLLDRARNVLSKHLSVDPSTLVLVPNATTGFDAVIRNLVPTFAPTPSVSSPIPTIVTFSLCYSTFAGTLSYLAALPKPPFTISHIEYTLPVSDVHLVSAFEDRVKELRAKGGNPVLAVFNTVSSLPGTRMPYDKLVRACRSNGVMSLVDGAHGVGMLKELDITKLDADFFVSNCHKWMFVPRPCAVLVVPKRNHRLIRASLPTGIEWAKEGDEEVDEDGNNAFVRTFAYTGTLNDNPYLCIEAALEWRKKVTWGGRVGEEAVVGYICDLAKRGGQRVAEILGTEILENEEGTLGGSGFANIRLMLKLADPECGDNDDYIYGDNGVLAKGDERACKKIATQIMQTVGEKYDTAIFVHFYAGNWWARLSAQIFVTFEDFERTGKILKKVCEEREWLLC